MLTDVDCCTEYGEAGKSPCATVRRRVRLVALRAPLLLKHRLECPLHFRLVRPVCLGLPLKPDPQQTRASEVPKSDIPGSFSTILAPTLGSAIGRPAMATTGAL
jgi:hypothetical protein